ncbi:MAG: hypothetical protein IIZ44_01020, partial [Muribaculaceae bacterium]|nr:hypothetical protein [Muribaculaceae bacterium]
MKQKILMTLALLLTAVTGAWADGKVYTSAVDITALQVGDILTEGASITGKGTIYFDLNRVKWDGKLQTEGTVYLYTDDFDSFGAEGVISLSNNTTMSPVDKYNNDGNAWEVTNVHIEANNNSINIQGITYAPTPIEVIPGSSANTWTFSMPGSDVVLTPIYSAATISHAAGTPEASETPFETLKEAFAAVQDGDVITLDWNVTLTETLKTPSTASNISFTLDFNGFVIDNTGGSNYIVIDNGCKLTLTDNSTAQTGGLKSQYPIAGSNGGKVIFQGGRYSFNGCTAEQIASGWDVMASKSGWVMGDGKEFVDLNNGQPDDDGFMVRVDWKTIELTIGPGRFATFYSDQNTTLADGTDTNIGLYTINGEGINLDNNTVTATKVNDPIAIAGMPLLVYNGTTEQKTVTLRVTPVAPTAGQMWSTYFQGTAVDKTF